MKTHIMIIAAAMTSVGSIAFADLPQKAATRIEFNSIIDQNNAEKQDLQKTVYNKADSEDAKDAAAPAADQKRVMDLVDIEVGVSEDRPVVVDRRYNSVGEPIVDKEFSSAKVQLLDKKADHGT
jgi:hypothetical protein